MHVALLAERNVDDCTGKDARESMCEVPVVLVACAASPVVAPLALVARLTCVDDIAQRAEGLVDLPRLLESVACRARQLLALGACQGVRGGVLVYAEGAREK